MGSTTDALSVPSAVTDQRAVPRAPQVRWHVSKWLTENTAGVSMPAPINDGKSYYTGDHEELDHLFEGDQFYYTEALVTSLLPVALEGPQMPCAGRTESVRHTSDPAEGGNLAVMLIDLRKAVAQHPDRVNIYAEHAAGGDTNPWLVRELVQLLNGE